MLTDIVSERQLKKYGVLVRNPHFDHTRIKGYILDSDDTAHYVEGGAQIKCYAERLNGCVPEKKRSDSEISDFNIVYRKILSGTSPAIIGRAFDRDKQLFLEIELKEAGRPEIVKVYDWYGHTAEWNEVYDKKEIDEFRRDGIFHLSGKWSLAAVAAYMLGVNPEDREACHKYAMDRVKDGTFKTVADKRLPEFIDRCKEKGIKFAICSNTSQRETIDAILERIGVKGKFDYVRDNAQKHERPYPLFREVSEKLGLRPEELASVENCVLNGIRPPKKMGMQTILVEVDKGQNKDCVDIEMSSFSNWINLYLDVLSKL